MNKHTRCRVICTLLFIAVTTTLSGQTREKIDLIYDDVWGSLYNPEPDQCDDTPTITADGSHIDSLNASQQRWIAVSPDLLWSPLRHRLFVTDSTDNRYQGKIKFGDTIWVESPNPKINGKWVVHDLMNKAFKNAVDFLQTTGDGGLYNNDRLWDGKFKIISVYKISKGGNDYASKAPSPWLLRPSIAIAGVSKSIQYDTIKYFNLVHNIFSREDLIRSHDKTIDSYWKTNGELDKTQHKLDSLRLELRKYYKQIKLYRRMIRELEKKKN